MSEKAQSWANDIGGLPNSITNGRGNTAGRLGELALAEHLGVDLADKKDYDMIYNGEKIEVKTKRRTVKPAEYFDVSVAETSRHQAPDRYVFISIEYASKKNKRYNGLKSIWLCGDILASEFFEKGRFLRKGAEDGNNKFRVLRDMYNLQINQLNQTF
jgi:hypothetical protein